MSERDLQKDLIICEKGNEDFDGLKGAIFIQANGRATSYFKFMAESLKGWPYAIQRAIAAEEKFDALEFNSKVEFYKFANHIAELAKIRKQLLDRIAELEKALEQLSNPTEFSTNSAIYMSRTARQALKGGGK